MELLDFVLNNLIGFITAITALIALFAERRKRFAEQKRSEADALQAMQIGYKSFVDDFNEKLLEMSSQITGLKEQLNAANIKIKEFEEQSVRDQREINMLRKKIEAYEKELRLYKISQQ